MPMLLYTDISESNDEVPMGYNQQPELAAFPWSSVRLLEWSALHWQCSAVDFEKPMPSAQHCRMIIIRPLSELDSVPLAWPGCITLTCTDSTAVAVAWPSGPATALMFIKAA